MAGYIQTAQRDDWGTPLHLMNIVEEIMLTIHLDPCGAPGRILPHAKKTILLPEDGLAPSWAGLNVFVNPPYGKPLDAWLEKCANAGSRDSTNVIALIPACTSRKAWQRFVSRAEAVCFLKGRLKFHGAPSSAGFSSALVFWGGPDMASTFCKIMQHYGHHVLTHP